MRFSDFFSFVVSGKMINIFSRDLFGAYAAEWNRINKDSLTVDNLLDELEEIAPYTIMNQLLVLVSKYHV